MNSRNALNVLMVGCGDMALHHMRQMIADGSASIPIVVDPSAEALQKTASLFSTVEAGIPSLKTELTEALEFSNDLDVAFIASPHSFHLEQAVACMEAGLDVLLEKPMVVSAGEAKKLIDCRDKTGALLVVAFPGSLSPAIREATRMVADEEIGTLVSISATVWQNWATNTANTWRQRFDLSGGGFLFDTGAHMLNSVVDIAGEEFVEVSAILRNSIPSIEYSGVIIGRLKSGAIVTLHGCGETIESCDSTIRIFGTEKILTTGVWGKSLHILEDGQTESDTFQMSTPTKVWDQFVAVRRGDIANPCPPEVGLRMARLWDAIRESAEDDGKTVTLN